MADVGIETPPSGLEVAENGEVGEDFVAGALEKQSDVEDEGKMLAKEKIEQGFVDKEQEGAVRGGEEGTKDEGKVKNVENEDEMQEKHEEVAGKKKRGRKPKAVREGGATPEAGEKKSSGAEKQGQRKRRRLSVTETPSDRPSRERKSIDRFVVSTEKERAKEVQILEGSGTPLKDIPNVAYSLGKRSKADSLLGSLHSLLYGGRRIKASFVKNNILQFSGFVWGENQEKDRAKVKERLERLTKENLIDISNLLDIKVHKTTIKKEELIAKILEFLESPYQTTDVLLEEKENGRKRKSRSPGKRTRGRPSKKQKSEDTPAKRRRKKPEFLEEGSAEEDANEEIENTMVDKDPDEAEDSEEKVKPGKKLARGKVAPLVASEQKGATEKNEKKRNKKTPSKLPLGSKVQDKSPLKVFSKVEKKGKGAQKEIKRKTEKASKEIGKVQPKLNVKEKSTRIAGKKQNADKIINIAGKVDAKGNDVAKPGQHVQAFPSDLQLRAEICELLREADFSTVTFTDVVKQLEAKFKVSLLERKAHVKVLIREEISKIAEEGEDEDKDDEHVEEREYLTQKS